MTPAALPPYALDDPAVAAFIVLPALVGGLFIAAVWRAWRTTGADARAARRAAGMAALGTAAWMAIALWLAASGVFLDFTSTPPPFAFLLIAILAIAGAIGFGPAGRRLASGIPLWMLVGSQGFRLPLELAMHAMYERGIMPESMSYSGRNWDIVTGASAIVVAWLLASGRAGRGLAVAWNALGLLLLANIVVVAILATPRFQHFGPDHLNVWVMHPPFVWLPAVLVLAAILGHVLVFRALATAAGRPGRSPSATA